MMSIELLTGNLQSLLAVEPAAMGNLISKVGPRQLGHNTVVFGARVLYISAQDGYVRTGY